MTEIKGLLKPAIAIAAVAVIVLMFGAILTTFSKDLRVLNSTVNVSIVVPENTSLLIGSAGDYPFLQSITYCKADNATRNAFNAANYSVTEGNTAGGYMNTIDETVSPTLWENVTVNCSISWLHGTATQGAADKFSVGLTVFATFMAVIVLAIVGRVVIALFKKGT